MSKRGVMRLLKGTSNLYVYIKKFRVDGGKQYRYLVIEEYLGRGKRKVLLQVPLEEAAQVLLQHKLGLNHNRAWFGAGGGIRTHAGLRQRVLSPPPLAELGHPRPDCILVWGV